MHSYSLEKCEPKATFWFNYPSKILFKKEGCILITILCDQCVMRFYFFSFYSCIYFYIFFFCSLLMLFMFLVMLFQVIVGVFMFFQLQFFRKIQKYFKNYSFLYFLSPLWLLASPLVDSHQPLIQVFLSMFFLHTHHCLANPSMRTQ